MIKLLRTLNYLNLTFYVFFIGFNLLEFLVLNKQVVFIHVRYRDLQFVHNWLDFVSYLSLGLQILVMNEFVKQLIGKRELAVWKVLVAMIPLLHLFLLYPFWKKINKRLLFVQGQNIKKTDALILIIWIFLLIKFISDFAFGYLGAKKILVIDGGLLLKIGKVHALVLSIIGLTYYYLFRTFAEKRDVNAVVFENDVLDQA